jgi:hypothetical protein
MSFAPKPPTPPVRIASSVAASLAVAACFIARTAFTIDGEWYFTLFDDAMISMRYARNLAEGHGLVWNPGGEPVEGYTNFLWALWMAILHLVPVAESKRALLVMVSGALILAANLAIVRNITLRLAPGSPRAVSLAVWLTALYYPLIFWTLRGMEVGLITLVIAAAILLALELRDQFSHDRLLGLALLLAAGVLIRMDVAVPAIVIGAFAVHHAGARHHRATALVLVGVTSATLALHTVFRVFYYGAGLPNTYYLKVQGAPLAARLERGLLGLASFGLLTLAVPVVVGAAYLLASRQRSRAPAASLLAAVFAALCAYSVYVGGDVWDGMLYANRYVAPGVPGLLILLALGIDHYFLSPTGPSPAAVRGLAVILLLCAVVNVTAPATVLGVSITPAEMVLRIAAAALTLFPLLVLPRHGRGVRERPRSAVAFASLALACYALVNGGAVSRWLVHNAFYVDDDAWAARYGIALRGATAVNTSIAVTWAGAIPYFSGRWSVDLLGKSDPVIARTIRREGVGFYPGHDKWDYAYSIGRLEPDVIAQLWFPTSDELGAIERSGYVKLAPWVFVRAERAGIDRTALQAAACRLLAHDPLVLGHPTRDPHALTDIPDACEAIE